MFDPYGISDFSMSPVVYCPSRQLNASVVRYALNAFSWFPNGYPVVRS